MLSHQYDAESWSVEPKPSQRQLCKLPEEPIENIMKTYVTVETVEKNIFFGPPHASKAPGAERSSGGGRPSQTWPPPQPAASSCPRFGWRLGGGWSSFKQLSR